MNNKRKSNFLPLEKTIKRKKSDIEIVYLSATNIEQIIYLNDDKTSWIKLKKLDQTDGMSLDDFEELWNQKPEKKLQIKIAGKIIDCPRYSKSFLKPYKFSGLDHEADFNLPKQVVKLLEFSKTINPDLNQSLVNWYESEGSIGKHSDDKKQLKEDSDIFSFSFGPAKRTFILEPKNSDKVSVNKKKYHVSVNHNTLVIMGGKCQSTHAHSVPKVNEIDRANGRRVNVTFRCFK